MAFIDRVKHNGKRLIGEPDYVPPSVTVDEWVRDALQNPGAGIAAYLKSLFPIFGWIRRYNLTWASGDLIAGITVGIVVVPQSMSYALIASLPAQYGLYSSFIGVIIYCLFATSKDVTIGPVAVMSLQVASVINTIQSQYGQRWDGPTIATTLAFFCGFIVLGIGLLRIGRIVEYIPIVAISAFMTGSALNIAVGQVAGLLGLQGVNTRGATYQVIIDSLKALPTGRLDASFGMVAIFFLYFIRFVCNRLSTRYPRYARTLFFINIMRNGFVIIILTLASWLYCRNRGTTKTSNGTTTTTYPIKVLGTVPAGFQHVGLFKPDRELAAALGSLLPVSTIVLLLEHIAIARSFGRVNGYKINPNQELIAIGVTNTVGTVFGAYPATGSFSRTAIKSKSGVRTPLAGIITGIVVIVALYGVTPAFYWIPSAGLSAIIIHAVGDLIASPDQVWSFWRVAPLEFIIWWGGVFASVFGTIEYGIYTTVAASAVLLIIRNAYAHSGFLGKATIHRSEREGGGTRDIFVPFHKRIGVETTSHVNIQQPAPGVLVYRHENPLIYPNAQAAYTVVIDYVKEHTRRGKDMSNVKPGDRPWNDPGPAHGAEREAEIQRAKVDLRAIVFDLSAVPYVDSTTVQSLIDLRSDIEKWADHPVEFHFATILSPWIRRALIAGGFGFNTARPGTSISSKVRARFNPLDENVGGVPYSYIGESIPGQATRADLEAGGSRYHDVDLTKLDPELQTPFFHLDLIEAVRYAEEGAAAEPYYNTKGEASPDSVSEIEDRKD